ncbi:MAG: hypothetical protein WC683_18525 [bacterium]
MDKLYRKGDVVRDGAGKFVAVWMRKAWYVVRGGEFATAESHDALKYARALPYEADGAEHDVSWKIRLIDRLGIIRSLGRNRT